MSKTNKLIARFDVWLINLDPTIGREIKKTRPCVIISPNSINNTLNTIIIAPLTHTNKKFPTRIVSNFKGESGDIMLDQIRCVDKERLVKNLGVLQEETAKDCLKILRLMFSN
jgi:mRNA interferase MazF